MDALTYYIVLALVRFLQSLPLTVVAWLGRRLGALAWWLDARHRRVTLANLTLAFGKEKSPAELRALAHENFRRLGENYASAVKTASMKPEELAQHVQYVGVRKIMPTSDMDPLASRVFAIGHFGNFELYAWAPHFAPGFKSITTYRALQQPRLDGLLRSLREKTGCRVFERRKDGEALRKVMHEPGLMVGLLCDQHAGRAGRWLPFFGHECSTNAAPAVLALRFNMPLHTAICFRTGLARWRVEIGDEIPTHQSGERRAVEDIMLDVNRAFELAIRRDPANWFWVHRRWKTEKVRPRPPAHEPHAADPLDE